MGLRSGIALCLASLLVVAGCASTQVTERRQTVSEKLSRPERIWVYDFIATPRDAPADSGIVAQGTPQTARQIETGRRLGAQIAQQLVADIQGMRLPAAAATSGMSPQVGDIVIRGYLLSIIEGSAARRVVIGFGSGASELTAAVEGFQVTPQGLRKLRSGTLQSGGSRLPGMTTSAAVAIATGNPVGLIVSSGMQIHGGVSGRSRIGGRADAIAGELADQLKVIFQQQGWVA